MFKGVWKAVVCQLEEEEEEEEVFTMAQCVDGKIGLTFAAMAHGCDLLNSSLDCLVTGPEKEGSLRSSTAFKILMSWVGPANPVK